jgi:hypothetical protein
MSRVEDLVAIVGRAANAPATESVLVRAERAFGRMPVDLRYFYSRMNGFRDMTPLEYGAVRIWSIDEWKAVGNEISAPMYAPVATIPIVADHMMDCWWYATDSSESSATYGAVYLIDGVRPATLVATNFDGFINCILTDSPSLYPA